VNRTTPCRRSLCAGREFDGVGRALQSEGDPPSSSSAFAARVLQEERRSGVVVQRCRLPDVIYKAVMCAVEGALVPANDAGRGGGSWRAAASAGHGKCEVGGVPFAGSSLHGGRGDEAEVRFRLDLWVRGRLGPSANPSEPRQSCDSCQAETRVRLWAGGHERHIRGAAAEFVVCGCHGSLTSARVSIGGMGEGKRW
jgi:hypothetical protein